MITLAQLRTADPRDLVDPLSYALPALIRTARLALESHPGNEEAAVSVALVLELAEGLSHAHRGWHRDDAARGLRHPQSLGVSMAPAGWGGMLSG
ncbi:hypothetical protein [Phaeovulum vinaykumarii]|uniref:Uncharacterized protein n=1 Tax=Phaeovulum vinaykumarii TaxID=407234 RepID=A0A1N7M4X6_9RHOB|nr:hypothetical protein [Phaeovulum vinaykumarii]SIS81138.1 hypothetical protein SAMN05421795_105198 [Phaeovulum vinaykumarii]SOC08655.1 hypothetical protein SAMN05878426_1054 [Phaeovulum vinaykumarii]